MSALLTRGAREIDRSGHGMSFERRPGSVPGLLNQVQNLFLLLAWLVGRLRRIGLCLLLRRCRSGGLLVGIGAGNCNIGHSIFLLKGFLKIKFSVGLSLISSGYLRADKQDKCSLYFWRVVFVAAFTVNAKMSHHPDFAVVVKNRDRPPNPWRWEIFRAGRNSAVKQSSECFSTMSEASSAGKKALNLFLSEFQDEVDFSKRRRFERIGSTRKR
jgi:hypothetical protein